MIVTLTANPSHDRTVNLAGRLERGAVQRAESVISQAGGKGVNISRACVAADIPSIAVLPAPKEDPFVLELLAAGIDCRPVHHEGDLRVNITITEPDGTTTKLNSPGPQATPRLLDELTAALRAPRRPTPTGSCSPARCRPARRRSGTPSWSPICATPGPGSPWTPATHRSRRWSTRLPGSAPHLMKPNGEELASFTGTDGDAARVRPDRRGRAAATWSSAGWRVVLVTLGPHGAVLVDGRRRLARHAPAHHRGQHRRCRRLQPLRLSSSGTSPDATPPNDSHSPWPTAARQPDCPARPSPTREQVRPELARVARLDLTPGG